jgi:hypothetical protein
LERFLEQFYLVVRNGCSGGKREEDVPLTSLLASFVFWMISLQRAPSLSGMTEEDGRPQVAEPQVLEFPDDIDWKAICPKVMYEILRLPNDIRSANGRIESAASEACYPEYDEVFAARQCEYARLGLRAISLARMLRQSYKLPSCEYYDNWNPEKLFQMTQRKYEALQHARKSNNGMSDVPDGVEGAPQSEAHPETL